MNAKERKNAEMALIAGVKRRDYGMLSRLLGAGARIDSNVLGMTPLHTAMVMEDRKLGEWLVGRGASANAVDRNGQTPLHCVVVRGGAFCELLAGWLVAQGASVNAQDKNGQTPLHCAVASGNAVLALNFLECGGDILLPDKKGRTALELVPDGNVSAFLKDMSAIRSRRRVQDVVSALPSPQPHR